MMSPTTMTRRRAKPSTSASRRSLLDMPQDPAGCRHQIVDNRVWAAIVVKLHRLYVQNLGFRLYRRLLLNENKWRAARYGINGKMIDFGKQIQVPVRDLILEYLKFVDDVVDELGSREEIEYVHKILEMGTGADRQIRVFEETGDLKKVVDYIIEETEVGVAETATPVSEQKVG